MIRFFLFLTIISSVAGLLTAKELGPDVSTYEEEELKWENGNYGYHVMFKTLLENNKTEIYDNNIADSCVDQTIGSTYRLGIDNLPPDAHVKKAFLVWAGSQPQANLQGWTDNAVQLDFSSKFGLISESREISTELFYVIGGPSGFIFDSFFDRTESENNTYLGFFTYRVDVTDFFSSISKQGTEMGLEYSGFAYYGDYTVSDLNCDGAPVYANYSQLVSGWALIIIYTSDQIKPQNIYIFDGFSNYYLEESTISLSGIDMPPTPKIKATFIFHEGDTFDPWIENEDGDPVPMEGLFIKGEGDWYSLKNECNPLRNTVVDNTKISYNDVFNSISSQYGWDTATPECIGGDPENPDVKKIEYAMDVDTFILDPSKDHGFLSSFKNGSDHFDIKISANKDNTFSNMMILAYEPEGNWFDIPEKSEVISCTPASNGKDWCSDLEHTAAIKIQNWGERAAQTVSVKASYDELAKYVPNSTEYAVEFKEVDGNLIAKEWIPVPDLGDGEFPLLENVKVADKLEPCIHFGSHNSNCDTVILRYRFNVHPAIEYYQVLDHEFLISSKQVEYYTVGKVMPGHYGACVETQEEVDLTLCGGTPEDLIDDDTVPDDEIPDQDEILIINDADNGHSTAVNYGCSCLIFEER